jgi:hypothetical protein
MEHDKAIEVKKEHLSFFHSIKKPGTILKIIKVPQ